MGKMMSLLEKYKIIEREDTNDDKALSSSEPETEQSSIGESTPIIGDSLSIDADEQIVIPVEEGEQKQMISDSNEHNLDESTPDDQISSADLSEIYHQEQPINTIYHYAGLDNKTVTATVFYLENLIQALPAELPEYVKKTTIDNIITASNIDIHTLLDDGLERSSQLEKFQQSFSSTNYSEISSLKEEIERLNAVIAGYQQTIKQKETLVQKENEAIETEKARINHILTFFKVD